jgi:hypothetical protein
MTPVQLYAAIQLDDEVMNGGKPAETKEASFASRIGNPETRVSDGKGGKRGKRGKSDRTKGKQLHRASQSFDGYVYDGRRPSDEYVKYQKAKKGSSYRECQFCTWPGHLANDCHKLKAYKAKQGLQNSTSQKSPESSKFITWEASPTELVASTTEMRGDDV